MNEDGSSTDEAHATLYNQTRVQYQHALWDEGFSILDDNARYDFGDKWQRVFSRIPQVMGSELSLEAYEKRKSEAFEAARVFDEVNGFHESAVTDLDSDGSDWSEEYSDYHWASVIGYLWVADKEALSSKKVLLVWYDDCVHAEYWQKIYRTSRSLAFD